MPTMINLAAISAVELRSDRLGPLDSIAHPLDPGSYAGQIWSGDTQVGSFTIDIEPGGQGDQITIDLSTATSPGTSCARYRGGAIEGYPLYAVFHCGGQASGLHVVLDAADRKDAHFDSRALQAGDYYAVTAVRPGQWALSSGRSKGAQGKVTVTEARPDGKPRPSQCGATIKADGKSFNPNSASVVSGDGIVFEVGGPDVAIRLALGDRPAGKRPRPVGVRYLGRAGARAAAATAAQTGKAGKADKAGKG